MRIYYNPHTKTWVRHFKDIVCNQVLQQFFPSPLTVIEFEMSRKALAGSIKIVKINPSTVQIRGKKYSCYFALTNLFTDFMYVRIK